jgi:hypothetical protein
LVIAQLLRLTGLVPSQLDVLDAVDVWMSSSGSDDVVVIFQIADLSIHARIAIQVRERNY